MVRMVRMVRSLADRTFKTLVRALEPAVVRHGIPGLDLPRCGQLPAFSVLTVSRERARRKLNGKLNVRENEN